jgi:hypothetical protein
MTVKRDPVETAAGMLVLAVMFCIVLPALFLCGLVLSTLKLIATPGGAAVTIALIGLYVWMQGGFA